jgi:glycosyltransferase involved in cell wall biosynthesis
MKKRVFVLTTFYFPHFGGAEVAAQELFSRFPKDKFDITIVTSRFSKDDKKFEIIKGLKVIRLGSGNGSQKVIRIKYPFVARNFVIKHKPDSIFCIMANEAILAANLIAVTRKVSTFLTIQEGYTEKEVKEKTGLFYGVYNWMYKKHFFYQCISKDLLKRTQKRRVPKYHTELIPNGVNLNHFNTDTIGDKKKELRKKYGFGPRDKVIITTSRLAYKNAVDEVIKALNFLPKNYKFLVCGIGELEKELNSLTRKLGFEDRVIFAGVIDHKELPVYIKASDVFIRASRAEGFGNSFIESMACGIPTFGTNIGGITDFLSHKKTGMIVKMDDPKDIAKQIQTIIEDKNLYQKVSKEGIKKAQEYSWDEQSIKTQEFIQKHLK